MSGIYSTNKSKTLASLADIDINDPVNDEVLSYEDGLWKNKTATSGASVLNDLTDVNITSLQDADALVYDATSSKWINSAPSGGGGATEYIYLEKTSGAAPITNTYQVVGDTNNPLATISENQSWFGGFASNGSFTFTAGGVYRLRTETLVVKTSAVPGGAGFWIGINENFTTPNTSYLIKLHYADFKASLPGNNCVLKGYTIPMEYILRPTVGVPYLLYVYGGGASFFVQGGGLGLCSLYIEKIG